MTNPLRELVGVVRNGPGDPLVLVDGISGLGAMPFEMDAWGIDLVVSASQKAWMGSPGIAIAALGERAWRANESAGMPRVYWDLAEARKWAEKGQTPWTPAVSVLFGLRVGVRRLLEEGREQTWARHAAIAAAVRPASRRSACASSRPQRTDQLPSPPPGCPMAWNGGHSTPPCAPRA